MDFNSKLMCIIVSEVLRTCSCQNTTHRSNKKNTKARFYKRHWFKILHVLARQPSLGLTPISYELYLVIGIISINLCTQ